MPPWSNPYLLLAIVSSMAVHFIILYVPFLNEIFSIVPLTVADWTYVVYFSFPVVVIDEVLKFVGRNFVHTTGSKVAAGKAKKD